MINESPATIYSLPSSDPINSLAPVGTVKKYFHCFTDSLCFQFTKVVVIVAFIVNVIGWAAVLILFLAGAANHTITDENTRKIWIEIASQVLNALFFVPIVSLLPWRFRDLFELHTKILRPRLLKRYSNSVSLIWIGILVWAYIGNAMFQITIALCLWSIDRDSRPTWVMAILVGFAIFTGVTGGLLEFIIYNREKKQKKREKTHSKTRKDRLMFFSPWV